jgi:hypothetical protein
MASKQKVLTAKFTKDRVTKGAVRFAEDGERPVTGGSVYVRKSALDGEVPDKLTATFKF